MLDVLASVPGKLTTLLARLSSTWAAKLDTLHDSRLTSARAGYIDYLDAAITSRASAASVAAIPTTFINFIQHTSATISNTFSTADVSLSQSVTTTKALIIPRGFPTNGSSATWADIDIRLGFVGGSTVRATRSGNTGTATVEFTVVEFK